MPKNIPLMISRKPTVHFPRLTRWCLEAVVWTVFLSLTAHANTSVPSLISEVTVYSDRALVTRTAQVNLKPGENIIEFPGLPLGLDDNSLRVNSDNAPGVKLESIEVRPVKPEAKPVDTKRLEDQLQALEDQKNLLRERLENNSRRSEYLATLANRVQNLIAPEKENKITPADLRGFLELQAAEDLALRESRLAIEVSLREVNNQIARLREQLQDTRRGNPVTTKKVVIVLTAEQEAAVPVKISYVMPGASWTPVYDLRSDIENNTVELRYYANVSQTTGEDWNNVMLTLSTARPNIGAQMGELKPWRITTQPPPPINQVEVPSRRSKAGLGLQRSQFVGEFPAGELAVEMPNVLENRLDEAVPMQQSQATVEQHGTAMVFRVPLLLPPFLLTAARAAPQSPSRATQSSSATSPHPNFCRLYLSRRKSPTAKRLCCRRNKSVHGRRLFGQRPAGFCGRQRAI
jgi:uncharacterized protein (TIGR02231 family)